MPARPFKKDQKMPVCNDSSPCFGKNGGRCKILNHTGYADGECPFCKERPGDPDRKAANRYGLLIIKDADGAEILVLPDCARCSATGISPQYMDYCPLYRFDDMGDLCVPKLCDEYREEWE